MPLPILSHSLWKGLGTIPYAYTILKVGFWILLVAALKYYFGGARNSADKNMHGKVVMVTGGTSGIGASLTASLARRGAQIILLTRHPPSDPFLAEQITDLRTSTANNMIYAEQVDLSSLHSIRLFATKWIDNAPPRRLDMLILCAATGRPGEEWAVNYLANFHLLGILSPALRAQPPDRDVRVLLATCGSYIGGDLEGVLSRTASSISTPPSPQAYGTSKLALTVFAPAFQAHLTHSPRPDGHPSRARVILVDPGLCRTPGTRRWLGGGSLWGLAVYLATWGLWWLVLKSREMGAESFLSAAMGTLELSLAELGVGVAAKGAEKSHDKAKGSGNSQPPSEGRVDVEIIKECRATKALRPEVGDLSVAKRLWEFSEAQIERLEKEDAIRRARAKKEAERAGGEKQGKGEGKGPGGYTATTAAAAGGRECPR